MFRCEAISENYFFFRQIISSPEPKSIGHVLFAVFRFSICPEPVNCELNYGNRADGRRRLIRRHADCGQISNPISLDETRVLVRTDGNCNLRPISTRYCLFIYEIM